jgi:hypothetical protein
VKVEQPGSSRSYYCFQSIFGYRGQEQEKKMVEVENGNEHGKGEDDDDDDDDDDDKGDEDPRKRKRSEYEDGMRKRQLPEEERDELMPGEEEEGLLEVDINAEAEAKERRELERTKQADAARMKAKRK